MHRSSDMTKGISVHLVSSSHWDREWYLTVEQYRFRLVECMDRALSTIRILRNLHT